MCLLAVLRSSAAEEGEDMEQEDELVVDEDGLPEQRLNLMSMMEGIGVKSMINVGLDWKYNSATAEDKITTPKIRIGHTGAMKALVHVEANAAKEVGLFTGSNDVQVALSSRSKAAILGLESGKGRWDMSVPDASAFQIGLSKAKPTLKLVDQKLGIGTKGAPETSLHIQSNRKGDGIVLQGNIDGKVDAILDASLTLESSADGRGRGVFLPHRGGGSSATAWFAGVPQGGDGFQIGSSASHLAESTSGPYTKRKAHVFVSPGGKVAIGHTAPEGQFDVQLLAGNKKDAYRAVNVRSGSINVDNSQGLYSNGVAMMLGEQEHIAVGSAKKTQEREIRLQTSEKNFVTVSRFNAYVGIGGVKNPTVPLEVKGAVKVSGGQIVHSMTPKTQEQMLVLNSMSTIPSAIGFRQADRPYLTISAGSAGATLELASKSSLTVANGKMGIGGDPTELFEIQGGDMLLNGKTKLFLKSRLSGTQIYENDGLRLSGGKPGKIHLEKSDLLLSNAGSDAAVKLLAGPAKSAVLQMSSGGESWKIQMSMAGSGSLVFHNKGPRISMTRKGSLGVGVKDPKASLHVQGSALLEGGNKAAFVSLKTTAESQSAGVRLTSASEEWKIMTSGANSKSAAGGSLQFAHGVKTHVVISKSGSLGVGLPVPLAGTALHVKGPSMYDVGKGKGKVVISTPNGNPGMSFFDNEGFRRMDLETHASGVSFTSAAGFFGVGTKSPKTRLHVYDAKDTSISLSRSGRESSRSYIKYAGAYMRIGTESKDGVQFDVLSKPKLTIHPNGFVGVNSITPKSQLQVGMSSHFFQAGDNTAVTGNAFFDGAKFKYTRSGAASGIQMQNDGSIGFFTAAQGTADMEVAGFGKPRMSVTNRGFVGVGTTNPDASLHLAATTAATLQSPGVLMVGGGKTKPNLAFDDKTVQARTNGQPSVLRFNPFGGDVQLFASSTKPGQFVTFSNNGRIGFGPKKPMAKLHISEGPNKFTTLAIGESKAGVGVLRFKEGLMTLGFSKSKAGATNKEDAIVITKGGNVGVGIASPTARLHVQGDIVVSGKLNVGGKQIVTMMEDMMKENKRLSLELAATKEMLMSMSANMRKMESTMSEMSSKSDA